MTGKTTVMVPVTTDELRGLAFDGRLGGTLVGIAADEALAAEFGVAPGEEAEAAALQLADVLGLAAGRYSVTGEVVRRQVVVAEVAPGRLVSAGEAVTVTPPVPVADVLSFFTGECNAALAAAVRKLPLDQTWPHPRVQHLLATAPLAWHDVTELASWLDDVPA